MKPAKQITVVGIGTYTYSPEPQYFCLRQVGSAAWQMVL
jgi:hypothetical protein